MRVRPRPISLGELAKKGINIDCAYATVHKSTRKAVVVLGTSKAGETGGA